MDKEKLDRYLRSVGKRTFVNCFELFSQKYDKCSEIELGNLIPRFDPLSQSNNPENSLRRKASYAMVIFKNNKEFEALKICTTSKKLDISVIELAESILQGKANFKNADNYQLEIERASRYIIFEPKSLDKTPKRVCVKQTEKYARDPQVAAYAKYNSGYKCEINGEHPTFESEISGNQYVEAHHIIPMELQDQFEYSLDIKENIIALCPNCHRALHYAKFDFKKELIKLIYNQRQNTLRELNLILEIDDLIDMYK